MERQILAYDLALQSPFHWMAEAHPILSHLQGRTLARKNQWRNVAVTCSLGRNQHPSAAHIMLQTYRNYGNIYNSFEETSMWHTYLMPCLSDEALTPTGEPFLVIRGRSFSNQDSLDLCPWEPWWWWCTLESKWSTGDLWIARLCSQRRHIFQPHADCWKLERFGSWHGWWWVFHHGWW